MPLPNDSVAANTLPEVTTIPTGKKLIFTDPDTNEGGIITLENLTKQILQNLTSQTFSLDQGTKTLVQALNELNSKTIHKINIEANTKYSIPIGHYYSAIILGTIGGAYCIIRIHNAPNNPLFSYILKDNWISNPEISIVSNECNSSQFTFTTPTNTAGFVWY